MRRYIVGNTVVAEEDAGRVVIRVRQGNHGVTYVWGKDGMTVTARGKTEAIVPPWERAEQAA
jgi:flagella basal body P-ring formation protein FlgA